MKAGPSRLDKKVSESISFRTFSGRIFATLCGKADDGSMPRKAANRRPLAGMFLRKDMSDKGRPYLRPKAAISFGVG